MYAWDLACGMHPDIKILTQDSLVSPLIIQPPHDDRMGAASMCHYTWGAM